MVKKKGRGKNGEKKRGGGRMVKKNGEGEKYDKYEKYEGENCEQMTQLQNESPQGP